MNTIMILLGTEKQKITKINKGSLAVSLMLFKYNKYRRKLVKNCSFYILFYFVGLVKSLLKNKITFGVFLFTSSFYWF